MFLLGMLVMWIICGVIVVTANTLNVKEDIKDFTVGGFWIFPFCIITNKIYHFIVDKKENK